MNSLTFESRDEMHIGKALQRQAEEAGSSPFILYGDDRYSFAEVNQKADALARGLASAGIGVGDRVAFCMGNCPEIIFLALAANKLGAVWVPINTDYKGLWLAESIEKSRPKILILDDNSLARYQDIESRLDSIQICVHGAMSSNYTSLDALYTEDGIAPSMDDLSSGDISAVLWTSGTTGRSKGVLQSHHVWFYAIENANAEFGIDKDDVIFNVLPMYNSAAWITGVFRALLTGLPIVIESSFSVGNFWQRIDQYGATQILTLGAMHMFIYNQPQLATDDKHSLRKWMAVPIPPDVIQPFSARFNVTVPGVGFGQSECLSLMNHQLSPSQGSPAGSCGKPSQSIQTMLVDDEGSPVKPGQVGELWVKEKEPNVMFSGYFDDEEATASAFNGDWYKTGDLMYQDEEGFYFFSDRKKDAVRSKGRNISTFEVEMVVRRHPLVSDCAAFGVPSQYLESEDELKLDVVLKAGAVLDAEQLARFINDNAPYFFVPRYVDFLDSLPYTPTQKVQKYLLREKGVSTGTWDAEKHGFIPKK